VRDIARKILQNTENKQDQAQNIEKAWLTAKILKNNSLALGLLYLELNAKPRFQAGFSFLAL